MFSPYHIMKIHDSLGSGLEPLSESFNGLQYLVGFDEPYKHWEEHRGRRGLRTLPKVKHHIVESLL